MEYERSRRRRIYAGGDRLWTGRWPHGSESACARPEQRADRDADARCDGHANIAATPHRYTVALTDKYAASFADKYAARITDAYTATANRDPYGNANRNANGCAAQRNTLADADGDPTSAPASSGR